MTTPEDTAETDEGALLRSLRGVLDRVARLQPEDQGPTPLGLRVQAHLGRPVEDIPLVMEHVPVHRLIDVDLALAELRGEGELIGVTADQMREHESFSALLRHQHVRFAPGPVDYTLVASSASTTREVVAFGVHLLRFDDVPLAVLQRAADPRFGRQRASLEILSPVREVATRLVGEVRRLMRERSVLRGQVLTFAGNEFEDGSAGAVFVPREVVPPESIVLAPGVLDVVRRHVLGIGAQRDVLLGAGQHLKRGVLLYGPPGTGKTLTVRHLVGAATDATVVLLAGQTIQFISEATDLARALQPAVVVLEDIDLIAMDRGRFGPQPLLFAVLDALDGLGGDADVTFLMTTNRVELLEAALAQRPGRVDLATEIPLPGLDERRRLFAVYGRGLPLSAEALESAAVRAEGTTASFAKELMRRVVLAAAEDGRTPGDGDLEQALDDLLSDRERLTRSLLGVGSPKEQPPAAATTGGWTFAAGGFAPSRYADDEVGEPWVDDE